MACFDAQKLQSIPSRNKDLVLGQLRRFEKSYQANYPSLVKYLCLLFFNENVDKFDLYSTKENPMVVIQPHKVVGYNTWQLMCASCTADRYVYLQNKIRTGTHTWELQVRYPSDPDDFTEAKGLIALESTKEIRFSKDKDPQKFIIGWVIDTRRVVWKYGTVQGDDGIWPGGLDIKPSMEDKFRIKSKDIIKFKYNCNTRDIAIKKNNGPFIKIIDGTVIPQSEYRLKLKIFGFKRIEYELLSYQKQV